MVTSPLLLCPFVVTKHMRGRIFVAYNFLTALVGHGRQIQGTPWLRPGWIQLYSVSAGYRELYLQSVFVWASQAFHMSHATCPVPEMSSCNNYQHPCPLARTYNLCDVFLAFSSSSYEFFNSLYILSEEIPLNFISTSLSDP